MSFNLKTDLNPDQLKAVAFGNGPLLILAGAGSGKTRALTYRAAHLIRDKGIDPEAILLLTFTNKAAGEMQQRLRSLVDQTLPFAGTFHSFCAKFLRRHGHHLGIPVNFLIYDTLDQLDQIKLVLKDLDLSPKEYRPRSVLSQISAAKNELISPNDYASLAHGHFQEIVSKVYSSYQARLKEAGALDFDDLLIETVNVLQSSPSTLEKFQHQFKFVLVDEYQDTNQAQYLIAKLISAKHKNLNAVGDASQSIYRWRGADFRNLDNLKKDFPDLTTIKLEQNYRSTQTILDAATSVISKNTSHPILALWTSQSAGQPINLFEARDQVDEADYVTRLIRESASGGKGHKNSTKSAILYRTNAQSRAFEEAFIHQGIPYTLVGGTKFYERKEIKDILAYLRLMVNPKDRVSQGRAEKIGKRRLAALESLRSKIKPEKLTTSELFNQVLSATNYLDRFDKNIEEDLARLENIKELQSVATGFDDPNEFLENVSLVENNTLKESLKNHNSNTSPSVTLMTIHSAKGLEFDQVFLVGLEEGLFPHSRSLLEPAELEEERRLCYVALTRARNSLHLTYARNRLYFGGHSSGVSSRFIAEIPENLLKSPGYSKPSQTWSNPEKSTKIDDKLLDRFLSDEVDIDELLK